MKTKKNLHRLNKKNIKLSKRSNKIKNKKTKKNRINRKNKKGSGLVNTVKNWWNKKKFNKKNKNLPSAFNTTPNVTTPYVTTPYVTTPYVTTPNVTTPYEYIENKLFSKTPISPLDNKIQYVDINTVNKLRDNAINLQRNTRNTPVYISERENEWLKNAQEIANDLDLANKCDKFFYKIRNLKKCYNNTKKLKSKNKNFDLTPSY